jgi:hypothetical protein
MAKSSVFQRYAQLGAATRAQEIRAELAEIERSFPRLGRSGPGGPRGGASQAAEGAVRRRTRTPMTAAQKRAVGLRMKAYWAARRKAAGKKG